MPEEGILYGNETSKWKGLFLNEVNNSRPLKEESVFFKECVVVG
jgi:hypothetical protein